MVTKIRHVDILAHDIVLTRLNSPQLADSQLSAKALSSPDTDDGSVHLQ